jgi:hypothetical protein
VKTFRYRLTQNNEYHALFDQVVEWQKEWRRFTVRERRYARKIATARRLRNTGVVPTGRRIASAVVGSLKETLKSTGSTRLRATGQPQ